MRKRPKPALSRELRTAARVVRLRYVSDREPGIQRLRSARGFRYASADGRKVTRADERRIRGLAIPPAWKDVWICRHPNGHLQATGRDSKGRKQPRYHAQWHAARTRANFDSLIAFAGVLPAIRRRVARDVRRPGLPREKVLAAVVSLLELTHVRIGNAAYAEANQSFGLSTLRDHHVRAHGGRIQLGFRGKSGKFHRIHLDNAHLARIIRHCQDLPGHELFQYLDAGGEIRDVSSGHVNEYLRGIAGQEFTAKDFRTWAGTVRAAEFLRAECRDGRGKPCEAVVIRACDEAAAALGNTRSVCRKHYIHPAVCTAYLDGSLVRWFDGSSSRVSKTGLKPAERAVVRLLKHLRA